MKRIVLLSLISAFALVLSAQKPTSQKLYQEDFSQDRVGVMSGDMLSNYQDKRAAMQNNAGTRDIDTSFVLDYSLVEFVTATIINPFDWETGSWTINGNAVCDTGWHVTLPWAGVIFDTLIDISPAGDVLTGIPYDFATVTVDSVEVQFIHSNTSGQNNTIKLSIYPFPVNVLNPPANALLWSDSVVVDTSLSVDQGGGFFTIESLFFTPNLTLQKGQAFFVRIDVDAPQEDFFNILEGKRNECGTLQQSGCPGNPSSNPVTSVYEVIFAPDIQQQCQEGFFTLGNDCDGDGTGIEGDACEIGSPENFFVTSYVTVNIEFNAQVGGDATTGLCPGDVASVDVTASGGAEPLTYAWNPTTGLSAPFAASTDITAGNADATYTVTITDANNATLTETVTVEVEGIGVDAGTDESISCGGTADLTAVVSGTTAGATFSWSNNVNTLNNDGVGAGTYTISASNSFGCTASDDVTVALAGVSQLLGFNVVGNDSDLTANQACQGLQVNLNNTSTDLNNWNFEWTFSDDPSGFVTTTDATHTYSNAGTFTVTLTADSGACELTLDKTVTVLSSTTSQCLVGINDPTLERLISVYPNPTTGTFVINFSDVASDDVAINVYNMIGREVYSNATNIAGSDVETIDISNNANGLYLVKIQVGNDLLIKKITLNK